jgi:hypothetical protein
MSISSSPYLCTLGATASLHSPLPLPLIPQDEMEAGKLPNVLTGSAYDRCAIELLFRDV